MSSKNSDNLTTIEADEVLVNYELNIPVLNSLPSINVKAGDMCYYNAQVYYYNGTQWVLMANASPPSTNFWLIGGNTTSGDAVIGTLNNYDVLLSRLGSEYVRLDVTGLKVSRNLNATQNVTVGGTLNVNLANGYLKITSNNVTTQSMILLSDVTVNSNLNMGTAYTVLSNAPVSSNSQLMNKLYVDTQDATKFTIGGDAKGTSLSIGTLDANNLVLEVNGSDQVIIKQNQIQFNHPIDAQNNTIQTTYTPTINKDVVNLGYLQTYSATITNLNSLSSSSAFKSDISGLTNIYGTITNLNNLSSNSAFKSDISGLTNIYGTITNLNNLSSNSAFKSDISGLTNIYGTITNLNNLSSNSAFKSDISGLTNIYFNQTGGNISGTVTIGSLLTLNRNDTGSEGGQVDLMMSDGIGKWSIDSYGTAASQDLRIYRQNNGGNADVLFNIKNDGKVFLPNSVSIGSTLNVNNNVLVLPGVLSVSDGAGSMTFGAGATYGYISNNLGTIMTTFNQSSGNVGINNLNAPEKLCVGPNSASLRITENPGSYSLIGTNTLDGTTNTRIVISGSNRTGYNGDIEYLTVTTGSHIFINGHLGSELMRIQSGGNVGIGTNSPSYKLDVAGDINVSGNYLKGGLRHQGAIGQARIYFNTATTIKVDTNYLNFNITDSTISYVSQGRVRVALTTTPSYRPICQITSEEDSTNSPTFGVFSAVWDATNNRFDIYSRLWNGGAWVSYSENLFITIY